MTLEELQKLCDEATPGPWEYTERNGFPCFRMPCYKGAGDGWHTVEIDTCDGRSGYNALFIAAARTYLPRLIAVARAAKQFTQTPSMEPWDDQTEADYKPLVEALDALEKP